jgi:hypothetical protein
VVNPPFDRFEPLATHWRTANALALAHASNLAYEDDPNKILRQLQDWGFPAGACRVFSVNTAQVLAAANDEIIVVAFRGTEPAKLPDWLVDAEIIQKPWRDFFGKPDLGRVHHGFVRNTSFVWEQLSQFVAGTRAGDKAQRRRANGPTIALDRRAQPRRCDGLDCRRGLCFFRISAGQRHLHGWPATRWQSSVCRQLQQTSPHRHLPRGE